MGELAQPGDIYLLTGPLGAGKTCLTQGIARGLEVSGYVRSPTFVLMSRYRGRLPLYHVDLYRLGGPEEAWDLGLDEQLFGGGVCVVEWADRASDLFPEEGLWVGLDYVEWDSAARHNNQKNPTNQDPVEQDNQEQDSGRTITFPECPDRYRPLLEALARSFATSEEVVP